MKTQAVKILAVLFMLAMVSFTGKRIKMPCPCIPNLTGVPLQIRSVKMKKAMGGSFYLTELPVTNGMDTICQDFPTAGPWKMEHLQ